MIERKVARTARVGIFAVAHATYWDQFEGLYENIMGYHADFVEQVKANGVDVVDFGMVDSSEQGYAVAEAIAAAKVDLEALCRALGIGRVRVVDPYDLAQCDAAIKEELAADEPSVIISRRPCALLKYVKHNKPIIADSDKCVGCKACMKIGCPAISIVNGKAKIDNTLCTGCGVCAQLCKLDALKAAKEV